MGDGTGTEEARPRCALLHSTTCGNSTNFPRGDSSPHYLPVSKTMGTLPLRFFANARATSNEHHRGTRSKCHPYSRYLLALWLPLDSKGDKAGNPLSLHDLRHNAHLVRKGHRKRAMSSMAGSQTCTMGMEPIQECFNPQISFPLHPYPLCE